ncbi:MAG: hypothetical protein RLZZ444_4493 [Pseudomonadota bacterium]|jgi:hypothetical protein
MTQPDEKGVYHFPGTRSLLVSNPPDVEFRLPAEIGGSRADLSWWMMTVVPIILVPMLILCFVLWGPKPNWAAYHEKKFYLAPMLFILPVIGLMGFMFLQMANRGLANLYVQLFEGGAKITLDENQIFDSGVTRNPIAWRDVASTSIEAGKSGTFVSFRLKPDATVAFRRFRLDHRIFNSMLRWWGGKTVEVSTEQFDVDPFALASFISAVAANNQAKPSM